MIPEDISLMYELLEDMKKIVDRASTPTPITVSGSVRPSEVTFRCYLPDNHDEFWMYANASKMYALIYELDQKCRSVVKYEIETKKTRIDLAEELRQMIGDVIDIYEVP